MKALNHIAAKSVLLFSLVLASVTLSFSQTERANEEKSNRETAVKKMMDDHRFVFKAQSVNPSRGRVVQLNSNYDLLVSSDTVRSYLPYFGRAYSAPIGGSGGGIEFLSRNFDYNQQPRKKGGWNITIRPKDVTDVREMFLTVFENGTASLRVSSNNREPISYNGILDTR